MTPDSCKVSDSRQLVHHTDPDSIISIVIGQCNLVQMVIVPRG